MTLGPLTNLAVALEREPSLPNLLAGWVLHGRRLPHARATRPRRASGTSMRPARREGGFVAWQAAATAAASSSLPLAMGLDVTEQARFCPSTSRHLAVRAGAGRSTRSTRAATR